MHQLVSGEITLAQASTFWNRTRVGAHRRLEAYEASTTPLARPGSACAASGRATDQEHCVRAAHARAMQLRRAGRALSTWAVHVRHMEMLRRGRLDASDATRMWRSSWRAGVRQLARYDRAAIAAQMHAC